MKKIKLELNEMEVMMILVSLGYTSDFDLIDGFKENERIYKTNNSEASKNFIKFIDDDSKDDALVLYEKLLKITKIKYFKESKIELFKKFVNRKIKKWVIKYKKINNS